MGFSNVTGKSRPKRPGCETKSERNKRKARQNDQETVEELRVVKAKRCGAKGGERAAQIQRRLEQLRSELRAQGDERERLQRRALQLEAEVGRRCANVVPAVT